jgi:hypothetical protein
MKFHKLKAGALQLAVFITAIIAILLSVFIVLVHSHSMFAKKTDVLIETVKEAEHTILATLQNFSVQRDSITSIVEEEKDRTSKLHKSFWGIYGKVYAESNTKGKTFEKLALVSGWQSNAQRTALYLKETNSPLIVVGTTKIEGKTYLPVSGVRAGNISMTSYYGNELVYGSISKSNDTLPKLPSQLISYLSGLQTMPLSSDDNQFINLKQGKTYTNSFKETVKTVFSRDELDLLGVQLIGNIIIRSDTKIKVAASSILKDVLLIAPEIYIESNVKGTFQAIASKQIFVGKDCELKYPSALVLIAEDDVKVPSPTEKKKHIYIDQNTSIKGMVCYLQNENKSRFEPQVLFKENTTLEGFLYCDQRLELLGNVYGSVYTNGFITKQFGSVYQNHIYNGTISSVALIDEYVGFPFENLEFKVAKWLY